MSPLPRSILLEVERKFVPGVNFIRRLEANAGPPSFVNIHGLGRVTFEDVYYDFQDSLCSNGIWLRNRDGRWQAKVRLGGDRTNSQFREIENHSMIFSLVKAHVPHVNAENPCFGLPVFARFKTYRRTWLADDQFKIVFDNTDFGHEIGEVELEHEYPAEARSRGRQEEIVQRMDRDIELFMDKYPWAFRSSSQRPLGKLSAYFALRQ